MNTFFLVVAPGLEELAMSELISKVGSNQLSALKIVRGGIHLEAERELGFYLNHILKIPTRVLLRLGTFPAKDFPKLFKRIGAFPWQNYLRKGSFEVLASTHNSRLKIKSRIEDCVKDSIQEYSVGQPFRSEFLQVPQRIFIRVSDDIVTTSVDCSGDPLYKRGYKRRSVEAPLRETLGGAIAAYLYSRNIEGPIFDIMAGSGTLLFELLSYNDPIKDRKFSYQNFPSTKSQRPLKKLSEPPDKGTAIEQNPKALMALKENADAFQLQFKKNIDVVAGDAFAYSYPKGSILICNPPYNERLKQDQEALLNRFAQLLQRIVPKHFVLIWPGSKPPSICSWTTSLRTATGGIPITINFAEN